MQAVIMAAGKSTRTAPLTETRPKAMLKVANQTVLEHTLEQLRDVVEEAIIVVGYKKEVIMALGDNYKGLPIHYVEQKEPMGTAHAVQMAEPLIQDRFIVINGDDLYDKVDIEKVAQHQYGVLAKEVDDPSRFGVLTVNKEGFVTNIIEKPKEFIGTLANIGVYSFDTTIFSIIHGLHKSERGEFELTEAVKQLAEREKVAYKVCSSYWISVGYAWDLLTVNDFFLQQMNEKREGVIEPGAVLKGKVKVGAGSVVRSGAYVEGPVMIGKNCVIGPNCFIRGSTSVGDNCKIGNAVEVKNSIIMDHTNVSHLTYIGDSILGSQVNLGAGTIVANLLHDKNNVRSQVKGQLIDTGRRKLGTIVGDCAKTGINTSIYPGRKIWPYKKTIPGEVVRNDII